MKGYLPLILIFGAIIGGIVWVFIHSISGADIKDSQKTIGTLTKFKQAQKSAGQDAVITYKVEGKEYENFIGSFKNQANVIGEKYEVIFDKQKPSNSNILRYKPIFLKSEKTQFIHGKVIKLHRTYALAKHSSKYAIEFQYSINEVIFKKAQDLSLDYEEQYPYLKEGNSYEVEYWEQNPERAIIHLDKPIK